MKNEIADEKLKSLFCEVRIKDAKDAPAFGKLVQRPEPSIRKFAPWHIAAAIAIVILLGAIASLMIPPSNKSVKAGDTVQAASVAQENWSSISNWRASTDKLLASNSMQSDSAFSTSTDALLEFSTSYNQ